VPPPGARVTVGLPIPRPDADVPPPCVPLPPDADAPPPCVPLPPRSVVPPPCAPLPPPDADVPPPCDPLFPPLRVSLPGGVECVVVVPRFVPVWVLALGPVLLWVPLAMGPFARGPAPVAGPVDRAPCPGLPRCVCVLAVGRLVVAGRVFVVAGRDCRAAGARLTGAAGRAVFAGRDAGALCLVDDWATLAPVTSMRPQTSNTPEPVRTLRRGRF
jgi:hypothetical protein